MPADWRLRYPVASKGQRDELAFPFPRSVQEKEDGMKRKLGVIILLAQFMVGGSFGSAPT